MGRILFYRTWTKYSGGTSGGQLKVFDAFEHAQYSDYTPCIYFPPKTKWFDNPGNFWLKYRDKGLAEWNIEQGDVLFFSGKDWEVLTMEERMNPPVPIINIAQPRQRYLGDIRTEALKYPAIRIVKSHVALDLLKNYGVNGPIYVVPDTIDLKALPAVPADKDIDILIVGLKNPGMAKRLQKVIQWYARLSKRDLKVQIQIPPKLPTRMDFLNLVARTKMCLFLPLKVSQGGEGFYLPALEAMAMRSFVICPDVIGNRDFCIHEQTCLVPRYKLISYMTAFVRYLKMSEKEKNRYLGNALAKSQEHDISNERKRLVELINSAYSIWEKEF